jgi:hypothetical protein
MEIINNYSMFIFGLSILGLAAFFSFRRGFNPKNGILLLVIAALLLTGWFVLRPEQATATKLADFQAELSQGQTVLLELQSPY